MSKKSLGKLVGVILTVSIFVVMSPLAYGMLRVDSFLTRVTMRCLFTGVFTLIWVIRWMGKPITGLVNGL